MKTRFNYLKSCKSIRKAPKMIPNNSKKYACGFIRLLSPPGKSLSKDTHLPPPSRKKNFKNSCILRHTNSLNVYPFLNSEL